MALDWLHWGRWPQVASVGERAGVRAGLAHAARLAAALAQVYHWTSNRLASSRLGRYVGQSLARRIFVSNVLGLAVLLIGIFWVSQQHALLVTAKQDSLQIQGEIIASAIAASASVATNDITFDPARLQEVGETSVLHRTDAFAAFDALELSIRPDRVGPVLRRLIQPVNHSTRARIYDRDGELVVDTQRSRLPQADATNASGANADGNREKVRVRTGWTKFLSWFDGTDLPVYHEIGDANGTYYPEVRQALKGAKPQPMLLLNENGHQIVSLAVPIQRRNATLGALLVSTKPGEIDRILARERWIFFSVAVMALLTTLAASMQLTHSIAEPVSRLSAAADHVSKSISARAELPDYSDRQDEVGRMSSAFRRMTSALYRRIEASEKFAADVAHELKNPLTAARSTAESMSYARTPEQREQLAGQIQSELKRLNRLISDVANASRLDAELARQETTLVDLGVALKGLVDVLSDVHGSDGRKVLMDVVAGPDGDTRLTAKVHEGRIGQVVTNLIDNAASFSPEDGTVTLRVARAGAEIELAVEDQGPGIPDEDLEKVFERFYSDRPEKDRTIGKNSGLGLSISREIVQAHGGRIWAENRYAKGQADPHDKGPIIGARFVVRLPATLPAISQRLER